MGLSITERNAPLSKHIHFTMSQDKRIKDACSYQGCTLQNFIHEATLERLAKVEADQRADKEYKERSKKPSGRKREVRGLGLRTDRSETAPTVDPPPAAPAPQVVVNVPAMASPTSNVSMLASFIAKGSILERDIRLDRAREILASSLEGASLNAAKKALDEAVAARSPKISVLDWFKK